MCALPRLNIDASPFSDRDARGSSRHRPTYFGGVPIEMPSAAQSQAGWDEEKGAVVGARAKRWASALVGATVVFMMLVFGAPLVGYGAALGQGFPGPASEDPLAGMSWRFTIGGTVGTRPEYEGAKKYSLSALPLLDIRYRDWLFLSARDGLGVNLLNVDGWRGGLSVRLRPGREESDSKRLDGMGDVSWTGAVGGFLSYRRGPFRAGIDVAQDFDGGFVARANAGFAVRLHDRVSFTAGPSVTWANGSYTRTFFGVTMEQSAASGYTAYRPGAGFKDVGVGGAFIFRLTDRISTAVSFNYKRLLGDAADSPLVKDVGSANQGFVGLSVSYRFGL